jgi:hypothetical protein
MSVEVKLLNYKFRFRKIHWREETGLNVSPGKSGVRPILIAALEEISGLKVSNSTEAAKVINALPLPVVNRVFLIYKGSLPPNRKFETAALYKTPAPSIYFKRAAVDDDVIDAATDRVMRKMEQDFGKQELEEAAEIDRQILKGSKYRGAVRLEQ